MALNAHARQALSTIHRCIAAERFLLTEHFTKRLDHRSFFWADVLAALDRPARVDADGFDHAGRSRWIVQSRAADGVAMGLVCAIGRDDHGDLTVFITAFWEDKP